MFVKDGVAYAGQLEREIKILKIKIVGELSLLVTFSTGEERIYDLEYLIQYPVYKKLKDYDFFKTATVDNGVIVWGNGEIDIAPEEVYKESFEYERIVAN